MCQLWVSRFRSLNQIGRQEKWALHLHVHRCWARVAPTSPSGSEPFSVFGKFSFPAYCNILMGDGVPESRSKLMEETLRVLTTIGPTLRAPTLTASQQKDLGLVVTAEAKADGNIKSAFSLTDALIEVYVQAYRMTATVDECLATTVARVVENSPACTLDTQETQGTISVPALRKVVSAIDGGNSLLELLRVPSKSKAGERNTGYGKVHNHRKSPQPQKKQKNKQFSKKKKQQLAKSGVDKVSGSEAKISIDIKTIQFALTLSINPATRVTNKRLVHDMNRPLSEYFCNSSHNTFLTGAQIGGKSSAAAYARVLLEGCRCIEIDTWDSGDARDKEPVVTHGHARCTRVKVGVVLKTIAKYAFITSPYPVVISLENHCDVAGQDAIAKLMVEHFGENCIGYNENYGEALSSPEALKGKLLLKWKGGTAPYAQSDIDTFPDIDSVELDKVMFEGTLSVKIGEDGEGHSKWSPGFFVLTRSLLIVTVSSDIDTHNTLALFDVYDDLAAGNTVSESEPVSSDLYCFLVHRKNFLGVPSDAYDNNVIVLGYNQGFQLIVRAKSKNERSRLVKQLDSVISTAENDSARSSDSLQRLRFLQGVKFANLSGIPSEIFSLKESKAHRLLLDQDRAVSLCKRASTNLARIYPSGTRITSSNFNPSIFWSGGTQMVC